MTKLEKEYKNVSKQREEILNELKNLEYDEKVCRYKKLRNKNKIFNKMLIDLQLKMEKEKYEKCSHVAVTSKKFYEDIDSHPRTRHGCIKCGLDDSILDDERNYLSIIDKIKYDYIKEHGFKGKNTYSYCDLYLARAIYSKIIEVHPDIDDETLIRYFNWALYNIRNNEVNKERKENRAKRLSLQSKFNKWNANDVVKY